MIFFSAALQFFLPFERQQMSRHAEMLMLMLTLMIFSPCRHAMPLMMRHAAPALQRCLPPPI